MACVMGAYPLLNFIPVAALAGIMLVVVLHTFKWFTIPMILAAFLPKFLRNKLSLQRKVRMGYQGIWDVKSMTWWIHGSCVRNKLFQAICIFQLQLKVSTRCKTKLLVPNSVATMGDQARSFRIGLETVKTAMSLSCHNKINVCSWSWVFQFHHFNIPFQYSKMAPKKTPRKQMATFPPQKKRTVQILAPPGSSYRCLGHYHCDDFVQMACWYQYRCGSWCRCSYLFHVLCMELSGYLWGHCKWLGMRWLDGDDVLLEMWGRCFFKLQSLTRMIRRIVIIQYIFNWYFQYMNSVFISMLEHLVFSNIYLLGLGSLSGRPQKSRWRRWHEDLLHPWAFLLYLSQSLLEDFESWQRSRSGLGEMAFLWMVQRYVCKRYVKCRAIRTSTPWKSNIDTKKWWFGKGISFQIWLF